MWLKFFHSLGLALRKTYILKVRSGGATACEILLPVIFVLIFAILYQNEPKTSYSTSTYECDTVATTGPKWDFVYLPRDLQAMGSKLALVGDAKLRASFRAHLLEWYPGLAASDVEKMECSDAPYPMAVPSFEDVLMEFDTDADVDTYVLKAEYGLSTTPIYAAVSFYQGPPAWSYHVRVNLSSIPSVEEDVNPYERGLVLDNLQNYFYSSYTPSGAHIPYAVPGFAELQTAVDRFILNATTLPAVDTVNELTLVPILLQWNCTGRDANVTVPIMQSFLRSYNLLPQRSEVAPFPTTAYDKNPFYDLAKNVFSIFFVLCFFYPVSRLIRSLVDEKETRIREGMRMMGMTQEALVGAWYIAYVIVFFVVAFACTFISSNNMFPKSDWGVMLMFFWMFGLASTALAYLISVFFSRAKVAAVVGTIIFIGTFFPYYAVQGATRSNAGKVAASLLAPVAFGLGLDVLTDLESNAVGVTWPTVTNEVQRYSMSDALLMLTLDFLVYTVLGWYLDAVVPSEFGVPRSFLFPFDVEYWGCAAHHRKRSANTDELQRSLLKNNESTSMDDDSFDLSTEGSAFDMDPYGVDPHDHRDRDATDEKPRPSMAGRSHFEPVGQHLRALGARDQLVRVRGLRKEFPTPDGIKVAVDNVDLDMYEGQIFALLGHNGAGKTTTMSMLTGLIPLSAGDASVYGLDVRTEMDEIRKIMGVCPQHDVLWDDMTVKEHLEFFAALKGVASAEIKDEVFAKIREVGLVEKIDARSADLSGGQKRKLSVAIALIGGSRIVFLDEPTSGMDPYSRRSTWNILQNNREGRIMVLTTHFMDEADLLGDRIGIMAEGNIRCCGSSMFLKELYGVGYNLTLVKEEDGADDDGIEQAVAHHVPGYSVLSNVGTELSFQVPLDACEAFPSLFREFEGKSSELGIVTYGIGVTTLEEVFLRVAEEGEVPKDQRRARDLADQLATAALGPGGASLPEVRSKTGAAAAASSNLNNLSSAPPSSSPRRKHESFSIASGSEGDSHSARTPVAGSDSAAEAIDLAASAAVGSTQKGKKRRQEHGPSRIRGKKGDAPRASEWQVFREHFAALFQKRWRFFLRDRKAAIFQMLIPVLALLAGLGLLKALAPDEPQPLLLSTAPWNAGVTPNKTTNSSNYFPYADREILSQVDPTPYLQALPRNTTNWVRVNGTELNLTASTIPTGAKRPYQCLDPTAEFSMPVDLLYLVDVFFNSSEVYAMSEYLLDTKTSSSKPHNGASRFGAVWLTQYYSGSVSPLKEHYPSPSSKYFEAEKSETSESETTTPKVYFEAESETTTQKVYFEAESETSTSSPTTTTSKKSTSKQLASFSYPVPPTNYWAYASYTLMVNTTAFHAVPTFLNLMNNVLYKNLTTSAHSISTYVSPFPYTKSEAAKLSSLASFAVVLFIIIAFSFIPASFAVFVVKEREVNAKHQQLISGVSLPAYWLSTYLWDLLSYVVPAVLTVVLIVAFKAEDLIRGESLGATISLIVLYGFSVAPFTYVLSYAFKSHSTAQTVVLIINMLCMILLLASFLMQQIQATCEANKVLRNIFSLIPTYALGNGLLQLSLLDQLVFIDNDCGRMTQEEQFAQTFTAFGPNVAGGAVAYMAIEAAVYLLVAIGIDVFLSFPALRARVLRDKDTENPPINEDVDVENERSRVLGGRAESDLIVLQNLRKVYGGKKIAVRDMAFGIPEGQVFGFLGVNGAGKTTTLKMLSGDFIPTSGTARLGGFDILSEQVQCRRLLGYCPQFDALLELLTVREHLELFARIKGVPKEDLESVIQAKIRQLGLTKFENKLAGSLSGGNKRKLSVAIALIGDPPIVFLDEPSTGMDPVARRHMWEVITDVATRQHSCSIVLTTHSMEECEALCQRVGIMVGGRLRCLGSIQHLKHRFGRGYMAEFKLEAPTDDHIDSVLEHARDYLNVSKGMTGAAGDAVAADTPTEQLREARLQVTNLENVCDHLGDPTRIRMVDPDGSGWSLASAFASGGTCSALEFAEWWAFESNGAALNHFMKETFHNAHIVERHGDFFRFKIPETDMPLSEIFAHIERAKTQLHFESYSLSQTTLEQIFNVFAAQQDEERGAVRGLVSTDDQDQDETYGLLSDAVVESSAPTLTAHTGGIQ